MHIHEGTITMLIEFINSQSGLRVDMFLRSLQAGNTRRDLNTGQPFSMTVIELMSLSLTKMF